jgi:hypothetical protein
MRVLTTRRPAQTQRAFSGQRLSSTTFFGVATTEPTRTGWSSATAVPSGAGGPLSTIGSFL